MPAIESHLQASSEAFKENAKAMMEKITEFRGIEQLVRDTALSKKERFVKRGKLLPLERMDLVLDRGAPFLELMSLAGYKTHPIRLGRIGNPHLASVDNIIVAVFYGGGFKTRNVRTGTGLAHTDTGHHFPANSRSKIHFTEFVTSKAS